MATEKRSQETYVISTRSPEEVKRLNWQHYYIERCMNGKLIAPGIPLNKIHSIADIGCGTGVWLHDISQAGFLPPTADGASRSFHGFDISSAMFPPEDERNGVNFHLLDVTKPIPDEWKEKFDFVAVRVLCLAIKAVDFPTVIDNIVTMIKPGGYLQWVDVAKEMGQDLSMYPALHEANQQLEALWTGAGFSHDPISLYINEHVEQSDLASYKQYDNSWTGPQAIDEARNFCIYYWKACYHQFLYRSGMVDSLDEGMKRTEQVIDLIKPVPVKYLLGKGSWSCLVGQKKE